jgi:hypothetical protein
LPAGWRHLAPPAYRFIRLGRRDDPHRQDEIARRRSELQAMGWRDAPTGTRHLDHDDGEHGVYMYADDTGTRLDELQASRARARVATVGVKRPTSTR